MKILNFYLIYKKLKHKVNLDLGLYVISKTKKGGLTSKIINFNHGISWEYNTPENDLREISLIEDEKKILAYPSTDMKFMIVLFDRNSKYYPHPNNLVIFYPDGKVKHVIRVPKLISEKAIKNTQNPFGEHKEGGFENVRWHKKDDKNLMVIDIYFAWDNTEHREFDPETGEFGKLIGVSGR